MDLEKRIQEIKDHFNEITEDELQQKLIKHGINEINPMNKEDVEFYTEELNVVSKAKYSTSSIYEEIDVDNSVFEFSENSFNEVV